MQAGKLRHRVTIQTPTETQNAVGEVTRSWAAFTDGVVWAAVEPMNGREILMAQQMTSTATTKVTIRYLAGVTSKMRVLFGTRTFEIEYVLNPLERNAEQVLLCRETT